MKKIFENFKHSKLNLEEREIRFHVNDNECVVKPGQLSPSLSLARYLREHLFLTGTKISCNQGGCGACVVTAYVPRDKEVKGPKVISLNSCITPVLSCDGWHIITVEGIGSQREEMHPIQERLAAFHGTQCGFCSPGMVMQMNSLLEENPDATMGEIEHCLDGNMCRCTGYRPIHDAFKSFASDASEDLRKTLADIEDAGGCRGKGKSVCPRTAEPCTNKKSCHLPTVSYQETTDGRRWYAPTSVSDLLAILGQLPDGVKYRLVAGNTGTGIYNADGPYSAFIDTKKILQLSKHSLDPLELGGGMVLADVMTVMSKAADEKSGYTYGKAVASHISKVASTGIRNVGTLAGNLMLKHAHHDFPSDIFILLEAVGAAIVVARAQEGGKEYKYGLAEWLKTSMERSIIMKVCMPTLSLSHHFRSFKITPRHVNAHAYVNAGLLINVSSKEEGFVVKGKPSVCFGGISGGFTHAADTEAYLVGKSLSDPLVLKGAMDTLQKEVNPRPSDLESDPEYRRRLTQGLLFKTILGIVGDAIKPDLRSGATSIERGVSKGHQFYETDQSLWPVNKGVAKVEGKVQCTGEAEFIGDMPRYPGELAAAMVQASQACCEIDTVDPKPALDMPGVHYFIDHKDVPGNNTCVPWSVAEEIFSSGRIHYAGQCIGLILAETKDLALEAARAVKVTYKNARRPILDIREAIRTEGNVVDDLPDFFGFCPKETSLGAVEDHVQRDDLIVVDGEFEIGPQYHFYMETLTALCRPVENNQIELLTTTQWIDFTQNMVASALGIKAHQIDMKVRRLGGGYGGKMTPVFFVATACAIASRKANKPVRFVLDLKENMSFTGVRNPFLAKYKAGVDKDDCLQFVKLDYYAECGWNCSEALTFGETANFAQNSYNSSSWKLTPHGVVTDKPRNTPCRAPGTTQGHAIIENVMEHLAAKLNMDPMELKLKNMLKDGDMLVAGVPFKGTNPLPDMIKRLKSSSNYEERKIDVDSFNKKNLWKKRGMSIVPARYGVHSAGPLPFYCNLSVYQADGTISVSHGGIEMGQGINTKVAQTVAMELGVPMEMIIVKPSDNMTSPNNCVTGGSTTSELTCNAAIIACKKLKEKMAPVGQAMEGAEWRQIVQACFFQGVDLTSRHMGHSGKDKVEGYDIWIAILTEVEVDLLTGERNIVRCDLIEDTGAALNPEVDIGQIEGGFVFSLGLWLQEQLKYDPETGQLLTNDTWNYKPPSCYDIPEDMRTTLCQTNRMEGILGSKATGEPSVLMGCSVVFALREALKAGREGLGIGFENDEKWINLGGPVTVEKLQMASGITADHFRL